MDKSTVNTLFQFENLFVALLRKPVNLLIGCTTSQFTSAILISYHKHLRDIHFVKKTPKVKNWSPAFAQDFPFAFSSCSFFLPVSEKISCLFLLPSYYEDYYKIHKHVSADHNHTMIREVQISAI